jgi:hypothetical protein
VIPPRLSLLAIPGLLAVCLSAPTPAQEYQGAWDPAFQHDLTGFDPPPEEGAFNAIHLALIPTGPHRGQVLAMDQDVHVEGKKGESDEVWEQRWSILDFTDGAAPTFENHALKLPDDKGDLFCCGHAWLPDGRLFVAGGSTQYLPSFTGGKMCLTFDPLVEGNDAWVLQPELNELRWYPTVTLDGEDRIIVAGGTPSSASHAHNSFEVLEPGATTWTLQPGPTNQVFSIYPRQHLLSSGQIFVDGFLPWSVKYTANGTWTKVAKSSSYRLYGSSVLLRLPSSTDIVAILGGAAETELSSVEWCFAGAANPTGWKPAPSMHHPRKMQNAVVLPDGSVFVVGGTFTAPHPYVIVPELYKGNQWHDQPPHTSPRDYHSTALLLPDGRVLSAAGDKRTFDYQIFRPHYLTSGAERPVITDAPTDLTYLSQSPEIRHVTLAPLASGVAASVILLRPGSVTHHCDYDQRYVVLPSGNGSATGIDFGAPATSNDAPRGYYMLFVVSSLGIPSEAAWVHIE